MRMNPLRAMKQQAQLPSSHKHAERFTGACSSSKEIMSTVALNIFSSLFKFSSRQVMGCV